MPPPLLLPVPVPVVLQHLRQVSLVSSCRRIPRDLLGPSVSVSSRCLSNVKTSGNEELDVVPVRVSSASSSSMSLLFQRLHSLFEESSGMMELTKLKDKVQEASGHFDEATNMVQQCRETVAEAQTAHDQAHKKHVSLLMRREEWSAEDAQDFVQMTAVEVTTRQALLNAQNSLKQAEQRAVQCQHSYMDIMRQRYHEEQMWQDKWRLLGTYGTWSLIAINTMVFVVGQYFTQAREMKRLKHMEELLLLNKSQNPSDPTITPEEKKADSSRLVEPSVESDQVAKDSKDTADTVDHTSTQQQTIPVSSRRGLDDDVTVELFGLPLHPPSLALGAAVSASFLIVVSLFSRR